jgi:hypothetical protein
MKIPLFVCPVSAFNDHCDGKTAQQGIRTGESLNLLDDPRSVHSMLASCDDGRAALYERFYRRLSGAAPHLDDVEIEACYRRFEFAARLAVVRLPWKWQMPASRWLMYARSYGDPVCWLA